MITDETYQLEEERMARIFREVGWTDCPDPDFDRIEAIAERATVETVIKESTSFIFLGFTEVIFNFLSVFFGSVSSSDDDYKA